MTLFLPLRLVAGLFLTALVLSGCCANNECACNDTEADAIALRFSADTTAATGKGFKVVDMDTIILKRYPRPYNPKNKLFDSVLIVRRPAEAGTPLLLNNGTPFAQVGGAKLNTYRYEVQYLTHPPKKGTRTTALVIDSVQLGGSLEGDRCCTCYTNFRKTVFAHKGTSVLQVDLKQAPEYIELTR
ncbi:MAG: hypothetical protein JWR44_2775 [Hymenobacter sp.]|nr:hypothetical protein [Hymenobacter sp.]